MRNLKQKHERPPVHSYRAKTLPFRMPLNGISDRTLQNHHDKLYVAYVEKKNEIENQLEELGREIVAGKPSAGNSTYSELRALKDGPSATQMLRFPSWLSVHATRLDTLAAVKLSGNGALMSSSRVTLFCARVQSAKHTCATISTNHFFIFISGHVFGTNPLRLICRAARNQPLNRDLRHIQPSRNL